MTDRASRFAAIPPVSQAVSFVQSQRATNLSEAALTEFVRRVFDGVRNDGFNGDDLSRESILQRLVDEFDRLAKPKLRPVINGTGVILNTNLGRAPVSEATARAMAGAAAEAVALEVDPTTNQRGGRFSEIQELLRLLTGAPSAIAVNNNCAALLLVCSSLAADREIIVSRGELVEIGGGVRVPEVVTQSGCRLVEVGTTNRTTVEDYRQAITNETAAILKVHPSNFRMVGFVASPTNAELSTLAREHELPLIYDQGSGYLRDGLPVSLDEPSVAAAIEDGAEIVLASGDKLLGGPQAGLVFSTSERVAQLTRHPLARAVRLDKVTLAGLAATLRHYLEPVPERAIPVWAMIAEDRDVLRTRAMALTQRLSGQDLTVEAVELESTIGGGSIPGHVIPSWGIAIRPGRESVTSLAMWCRLQEPAIFGRIEDDRLVVDLRTVREEQLEPLAAVFGSRGRQP